MSAHARLSPSASHRWAHCTASVHAIEEARRRRLIPDDESSEAADQGTAAHSVREKCLTTGKDAHDFIGSVEVVNGREWPVTEEMADYLQPGIDWIRERSAGGKLLIEEKVALDPWLPGQFGTVDCAFAWVNPVDGVKELVLSDLKYGFVAVEAEGNPQQMIYALGVLRRFYGMDRYHWPPRVRIMIDQPRRGGIKEWSVAI